MIYRIEIKEQAELDLLRLAKSEPKAFAKAQRFLEEMKAHPKTGTGHPEPLRGDRTMESPNNQKSPYGVRNS